MKRLFCIVLILGLIISYTVMAQKKYSFTPEDTMDLNFETFDFDKYKDKLKQYNAISYKFEKEDSTVVQVSSVGTMSGSGLIYINIFYPKPYFYYDHKCYYSDGKLKEKGRSGLQAIQVGKWLECDEEGNCRIVDYEKIRGRFSYEDVLKFMAKQGHINLKTGEGREQLLANYNYEQQVWNVGTSRGYLVGRDYILDGNSGKVLKGTIIPFTP
jgi:hypothetical protein